MFGKQLVTRTEAHTVNTADEHTEVRIDALGRVHIEGQNFRGDACTIMGEKLRAKFGGGGDRQDKPEMHESVNDHDTESIKW